MILTRQQHAKRKFNQSIKSLCEGLPRVHKRKYKDVAFHREEKPKSRPGRTLLPSTIIFPTEPGIFISNVFGSEGNTGKTAADPISYEQFKTLKLKDDTNYYFNRGDIYNQFTKVVDKNNNRFGAYGTGADPKFKGSRYEGDATWTNDAGNIYYMSLAEEPLWVYFNGVEGRMSQTDWIIITARPGGNGSTQLSADTTTLDNLNSAESLVGSKLWGKAFTFRPSFRFEVTAYSAGTITVNAAYQNSEEPQSNAVDTPFKLYNRKTDLTQANDWCYVASEQRLYVRTAGASPAGTDIRVGTEGKCIDLLANMRFTISDIEMTQYFEAGIYAPKNPNLSVTSCTFTDIRIHAITALEAVTGTTITQNTFERISNNAVHIGALINFNVSSNTFSAIGEAATPSFCYYETMFRSVGVAVHVRWDVTSTSGLNTPMNGVINYNSCEGIGYSAFTYTGENIDYGYNFVNNCMTRWNDGGGFYGRNIGNDLWTTFTGTVKKCENINIFNNIITNVVGSIEGFASGTIVANGVQVDEGTEKINIYDNGINHCTSYGILSNAGNQLISVTGNLVAHCTIGQIRFTKSTAFTPAWGFVASDKMTCTGNIVGAKSPTSYGLYISSADAGDYNPFANGGSCDNNRFIQLSNRNVVFYTTADGDTIYGLTAWRTKFGTDTNSTEYSKKLAYVNETTIESEMEFAYNFTASPVVFNSGNPAGYSVDINGNYTDSQNVPAYGAILNIFAYPVDGAVLVSDAFNGTAGVNLTAHSPDVGGAWTVPVGAAELNGSGGVIATTAAHCIQNPADNIVGVEFTGRMSATGQMLAMVRWQDNNNYVYARLSLDTTTNSNRLIQLISRSGGVNTTLGTWNYHTAGFVIGINTDQIIKIRLIGTNRAIVFWDGLRALDVTSATITGNNPTGTNHGVFCPVVGTVQDFKIYDV